MRQANHPINPLVRGSIDEVRNDIAYGWIFAANPGVRPLLLVDNEPAALIDENCPRPDVCEAFNVAVSECPGFMFRLPPASAGADLRLFGVTPDGVYLVAERKLDMPVIESNLLAQMEAAAKISAQKDAVGIVCWDGAHNPIGRAKVLYDIAATHRPVVLLCYLHKEFGGKIWAPLVNWDANIVTIPWSARNNGHVLLSRYGIKFGTIWISKPRLPSFILASAVARDDTRFVLDIDDDENAFFSKQYSVPACYDAPGANLAHYLRDQILARTVSGPALQEKFGGQIVRHARKPISLRQRQKDSAKNIIFCGTARPHKNLPAIIRAVNILATGENLRLHFHVYGDIQPPEHRKDLEDTGAIVHEMTSMLSMDKIMEQADVLVSGFYPAWGKTEKAIADCQVPSKISDALSAGRPVLVPQSEAVKDLHDIPGIFIFNENNFLNKLLEALNEERNINIPEDFTPEGAYPAFAKTEKLAPAGQILNCLEATQFQESEKLAPTLVLVWKQHDAGLYGRRVDQIARSYKRKFPGHNVIILEFIGKGEEAWLDEDEAERVKSSDENFPAEDFCNEKHALEGLLALKKRGLTRGGIYYKTIEWSGAQNLRKEMSLFLEGENLLPSNAIFVLFPIIEKLEDIGGLLRPYRKIIDVVDNEIGWAEDIARQTRVLKQYFELMQGAEKAVFNSPTTRDFFVGKQFIALEDTCVIPNWYSLPEGFEVRKKPGSDNAKHIFYSGNMNDRIDWDLLRQIASLPDVKLHLAGTANRKKEKLIEIIDCGAIYHGVLPEKQTLSLLGMMDAAIMAHVEDNISKFMNPIKIGMYQTCGVPVIAPGWLKTGNCARSYQSVQEGVDCVLGLEIDSENITAYEETDSQRYIKLLVSFFGRMQGNFESVK